MGKRAILRGLKQQERLSHADVRSKWSYTSSHPYAFVGWGLIKHRDNPTLPRPSHLPPPPSTYKSMTTFVLQAARNKRSVLHLEFTSRSCYWLSRAWRIWNLFSRASLPRPRERKLIFHEDVAVTSVVISTPSPPGNISVSIASTMVARGGVLHPSRQDFNNTQTSIYWLCMCVQSLLGRPDNIAPPCPQNTKLSQPPPPKPLLDVGTVWPCPAKLKLIFAAHKFTEYYKNECNAGKDGGELINIWQW
jgi:hypothetical protein